MDNKEVKENNDYAYNWTKDKLLTIALKGLITIILALVAGWAITIIYSVDSAKESIKYSADKFSTTMTMLKEVDVKLMMHPYNQCLVVNKVDEVGSSETMVKQIDEMCSKLLEVKN